MESSVEAIQTQFPDKQFLARPSDIVTQLSSLVDQFQTGQLTIPPHQRDFVWSEIQCRRWIERLKSGSSPIGSIATYQLTDGSTEQMFINDGSQRIRATAQYIVDPMMYGDNNDVACAVTRSIYVAVQHRQYKNHTQAMADFQLVNMGTHLTPFEFNYGILAYMPNWSAYQHIIDDLHRVTAEASSTLTNYRSAGAKREQKHRYYRDDFALLHRFIEGASAPTDYDVSHKKIKYDQAKARENIEWQIRQLFEKTRPSEIGRHVELLRGLIERETRLFEDIWHRQLGRPLGEAISITTYRLLLHAAIVKRTFRIPQESWEDFVYRLLKAGQGKSQVLYSEHDGTRDYNITLHLAEIGRLSTLCKAIGSDFWEIKVGGNGRRGAQPIVTKPGVDVSHIKPVSTNGAGPTILEPAGRNRARGARPIDEAAD